MSSNTILLLFFLIIYNLIVTFLMLYGYYEFRERIDSKDRYIEELHFQLANMKKK